MMGRQEALQGKLFHLGIDLEKRVRVDHPLRRMAALIDFEFVYAEVADRYGVKGNVSVPPPVILKLLVLLSFYNVRSERELMATVPERLDWLWFLGFDLDSAVPDHSVLSKARARWGVAVFRDLFERIVQQCVSAGLVDGARIFVDSSFIDAHASNSSVVDRQASKLALVAPYDELERRLTDPAASPAGDTTAGGSEAEHPVQEDNDPQQRPVNRRYVSTTDADAAIIGPGRPRLAYKAHRAVDARAEVITATEVTRGDVNEAHRLIALWQQHRGNTGRRAAVAVADSKYGTIENFLACHDRGIAAHMPDLKEANIGRARTRGIFPDALFAYDAASDTYICPGGHQLKRKSHHAGRDSIDYAASKRTCDGCALRSRCTRNKVGRSVKRHLRQAVLDRMRAASRSSSARRDIRTRQHLMERSFARGERLGFKRARWRGLWRVQIQEYLTASVQNIGVLMRYGSRPPRALAQAARPAIRTASRAVGDTASKPTIARCRCCAPRSTADFPADRRHR